AALPSGIVGVRHVRLTMHEDHRGSLMEVVDLTHPFWEDPIVYAYRFTIMPGRIKGWGRHKLQDDRYVVAGSRPRTLLLHGRVHRPRRRCAGVGGPAPNASRR